MCAKARQPIRHEILNALGFDEPNFYVAAVCVYHSRIADALDALGDADIPIAAVSTGFPAGQSPFNQRLGEIGESVAAGAREIDIVISREHVLTGDWQALYNEVKLFREACGAAHLKTILATGELGTLTNVMRASYVCMMAGADFIKTSTGKENVNATLEFGLVMTRAIRDYQERTGYQIGFKPAGGIRTAKDALNWLVLIKEELGDEWLTSERFRFGASSLLDDIERQLSHAVTGRYAARHHIAMG
jgi:deoxyribose-phosphate aldolase